MIDSRALLPRLLRVYPFQPATALWRASEVAELVNHGLPSGTGLDVGCGDGLLTTLIHELAAGQRTWVGIDPDSLEVEIARGNGLYSECLVATGGELPFEAERFDFALSNSVLEHIADPLPVLRDVARVLRPGGRFVLTVPSNTFHVGLRGPLLPWVGRAAYERAIDLRCAHRYYWSEDRWRHELRAVGLTVRSVTPYLDVAELRRWESCSRLTAGVLYHLFRRQHQPIDIQRFLGLRRRGRRTPQWLARLIASLIGGVLGQRRGAPYGCLLIDAEKAA